MPFKGINSVEHSNCLKPAHPQVSRFQIMELSRTLARKTVRRFGFEVVRLRLQRTGTVAGEDAIIDAFVESMNPPPIAVDIGACDGCHLSNTLHLFSRGWEGLAVECRTDLFAKLACRYAGFDKVNLARTRITPENVATLLRANGIPDSFGFLNLDIDGFDYFILDRLLETYRPALICAEINAGIPPPLRFARKFDENYYWDGKSQCYGMSISMLEVSARRHRYSLVALEYNNAFLVPDELRKTPALDIDEAYEIGYLRRPDRLSRIPQNLEFECLRSMSPEDGIAFIKEKFHRYEGAYLIEA